MNEKFYRFAHALACNALRLLFPMEVVGRDHVPETGALIVYGNHISLRDPIAVAIGFRRPIHFMAKKELFSGKFFNRLFRSLGAFPVDRGGSDMNAIRSSLSVLKESEVLGIFPQGTRDLSKGHMKMENGVSLIALKSGATLVPVYIDGYRLFRKNRLIIGSPIALERAPKVDSKLISETTTRLSEALWALEPERKSLPGH